MGFYGNITNTSRTQFQFDKVYSNRHEMELAMGTDGIYMGRYVLIDYDQQNMDNYRQFYVDNPTSNNAKFYMWAVNADKVEVKYPNDVKQNEIIRATSDYNLDGSIKNNAVFYFYKCTNTGNPSSPVAATFIRVSGTQNIYTTNY